MQFQTQTRWAHWNLTSLYTKCLNCRFNANKKDPKTQVEATSPKDREDWLLDAQRLQQTYYIAVTAHNSSQRAFGRQQINGLSVTYGSIRLDDLVESARIWMTVLASQSITRRLKCWISAIIGVQLPSNSMNNSVYRPYLGFTKK